MVPFLPYKIVKQDTFSVWVRKKTLYNAAHRSNLCRQNIHSNQADAKKENGKTFQRVDNRSNIKQYQSKGTAISPMIPSAGREPFTSSPSDDERRILITSKLAT